MQTFKYRDNNNKCMDVNGSETKISSLSPCRFLHFRKYIQHRDLMCNFLNNGPQKVSLKDHIF
jgi:hypothetical protein